MYTSEHTLAAAEDAQSAPLLLDATTEAHTRAYVQGGELLLVSLMAFVLEAHDRR